MESCRWASHLLFSRPTTNRGATTLITNSWAGFWSLRIYRRETQTWHALFTLTPDIQVQEGYKGLGAALSHRRRSAAEHGASHQTACKLGALFEQVLPSKPKLFKAYGLRASEIAQSPLINPKGSQNYGPFADHIGVDGTTIWAAATSGKGAVAIHLLACMLARLWPPSEAIAIWEQILEERKKELSNWDAADTLPMKNLTTGQIEVSRDDLAGWDASARA